MSFRLIGLLVLFALLTIDELMVALLAWTFFALPADYFPTQGNPSFIGALVMIAFGLADGIVRTWKR